MKQYSQIIDPQVIIFTTIRFPDADRLRIIRSVQRMAKFDKHNVPFMMQKEKEIQQECLLRLRN